MTDEVNDEELLGLLGSDDEGSNKGSDKKKDEESGEDGSDEDADEEEDESEEEGSDEEEEDDDDEPATKRQRTEGGEKKKKKKKKGAARFLDLDAGEGTDEDDDMAPDPEDLAAEQEDSRYIDEYKGKKDLIQEMGDRDAEEVARELEAKHRKARQEEKNRAQQMLAHPTGGAAAFAARGDGSARFAGDLLPKATDPKVFAVKCRPNCAKQTVARLVNKCHAYRHGKNHEKRKMDLGIISAFALDHVKEWFYVESHRQLFVENAVNGLENVFRYRIVPVDPSELMQLIMNTGKPKEAPKVGELARLRVSPYKNDLCQITKVMEGGNRVKIKAVPRVDFVNKTFVKVARKNQPVHPQRFFASHLALGASKAGDGGHNWGEFRFDKDGYITMDLSSRAIMFGSKFVKPGIEEISSFMKEDKTKIASAANFSSLTDSKVEFSLGDDARVSRGQLEGAVGKIVDISPKDGQATLLWQLPGQAAMESRVELIDCTKYFADGSHVQVDSGPREGESGLVLAMDGENVVFLNENTQREDQARANDCRKCSIKRQEKHSLGSWNLYDLVQLNDQTVGVLTRLGNNDMTILTLHNSTKVVPTATIKQTLRQKADCMDYYNNVLTKRSAVNVMPRCRVRGLQGKTGELLQIYNETVFIRVDTAGKPSVVAAVDGKSVALLGGVNKIGGQHAPRKEPNLPDRPVYFAAPPTHQSASYNPPSMQWQATKEYNLED